MSTLLSAQLDQVRNYFTRLQLRIRDALESLDSQRCVEDGWKKSENNSHGLTCVLRNGDVFEQAGVGFSHVWGEKLPASATEKRPELVNVQWEALGVSLVIHPRNPYVPTTHANVRYFVAYRQSEPVSSWFGGGMDLTPYYPFDEDILHWHQTAHCLCLPFEKDRYARHKDWCDKYFYLPHRQETRGIGGLFYDDLDTGFASDFAYTQAVGDGFLKAYLPIVQRRLHHPYGERERNFQCYRRGRYVEFNLLYDRGTLFGLQSGGRTESILMSLPPAVRWEYGYEPTPGSPEAALAKYLQPQDWLGLRYSSADSTQTVA